jgi:hypothetical protein
MSCSNSRCVIPCKREGSCEKTSDCCDGYYCSENKVCTKSTTTCQTSGSCAVGASVCCDGYYCNDNLVCTPEQAGACSDSDGMGYYSAGYATGEYEGVYGTYYDYCLDTNHVVEYYCAQTAAMVASTTYTCPNGCSGNACK